MTMNGSTTEPKTTKTTPTRGESAVRHLYKRALEEDRQEDAKLIASVANLLKPDIKLSDGLPFDPKTDPKKSKVDSAEVNGQAVDLTEMGESYGSCHQPQSKLTM